MVEQAFWEDELGTTKNGKPRTVCLTSRLAKALHDARHLKLQGGRWVLPSSDGSHLTRDAMRWHLPRVCRKAEIGERQWHPLRHTFCTHLAMRGAPVRTIQELAGHNNIATTLRYMHLVRGAKEQAIALLEQPSDKHPVGTGNNQTKKSATTNEGHDAFSSDPTGSRFDMTLADRFRLRAGGQPPVASSYGTEEAAQRPGFRPQSLRR